MLYPPQPLSHFDRLGLTQCDIDIACRMIRAHLEGAPIGDARGQHRYEFPSDDLISTPSRMPLHEATKKPASGYTHPANGIFLHPKYLGELSDGQALDLLDTLVHEGVHWSLPWNDPRQNDASGSRSAFPYRETERLLRKPGMRERFLDWRERECP